MTEQKPPAGLLADVVLKAQDGEARKQRDKEFGIGVPPPPGSSLDPNYQEPTPPDQYRALWAKVSAPLVKMATVAQPMDTLFEQAIKRIEVLESALLSFGVLANMMANARMALAADGRLTEPAGGTWVNGVNHAHMQSNEGIYFDACDAYGRARIEAHMMERFRRIQEAAEAQAQKDQHVEDGGKSH